MVRLRLKRFGKRHRPHYRICAIDQRSPRNGKPIEELGWYDPLQEDPAKAVNVDADRAKHWLSVGAQPSDTVRTLLQKAGVIEKPATPAASASAPAAE